MHASSTRTRDGHDYEIILDVNFNNATVKVEDINTHERWEANFDAPFIEELTKKVGSLKKFPVFMSMLESAIKETSPSVNLQLLSYSDLEVLRSKKFKLQSSIHSLHSLAPHINSKKFLVLSHTDEFDSVHYPLALSYLGILDVRLLQDKLKKLELELATYRNQEPDDIQNREMYNLRRELDKLKKEKSEIEKEFKEYKQLSKEQKPREANKLKTVIYNLENDLTNQVTRHQNSARKKTQENKMLKSEMEKLRGSERRLRIQLRNLTNEVIQLKRSKLIEKSRSRESSIKSRHSIASNSSRNSKTSSHKSKHVPRNQSLLKPTPSPHSRNRTISSDRSTNLSERSNGSWHRRNPSPPGNYGSRFDPTAYVMEKEQRRFETQKKRRSLIESRINGQKVSISSGRSWSDNEIKRQRQTMCSSLESISDSHDYGLNYSQRRPFQHKRCIRESDSRADFETEVSDGEPGMSDIDARLARLQKFMEFL